MDSKRIIVLLTMVVVLILPCTVQGALDTADIRFDYYGAGDPVNVWAAGLDDTSVHGGARILYKSDGTGQGESLPDGDSKAVKCYGCCQVRRKTSTVFP